jgi:adenine-specific DNA-methyltransferase
MPLTTERPKTLIGGIAKDLGGLSLEHARALTFEVVLAYWQALGDNLPLRDVEIFGIDLSPAEVVALGRLRLQALGDELAAVSPLDASFVVGRIYTALLPRDYRAKNGIYFTPPALTRRLLDLARASGIDMGRAQVLDPACGGGAFLAPVTSAKLAELKDQPPADVLDCITATVRGFEIDPFSAWLSQVFLDTVTRSLCQRLGTTLPVLVEVRDALEVQDQASYDLVIGNPPYGRVQLEGKQRERFERSLYGHANLYGLFTDLALRLARPGGVIAFVTPTSFLAGQYFKNLRRLLADHAPPEWLEFISDREGVFDDVLQETLLATYRRVEKPQSGRVRLLRVQAAGDLEIEDVAALTLPREATEPWLIPREPQQAPRALAAHRKTTRLADLGYRVSTGPLVWNRHKPQLRSSPGDNCYPLIWAEAVTANGSFIFRAEKKNHEPYFEVRLPKDAWLLVDTPCVLLQRTTSKEQRRRLIAAELPEAFLEEHGAAVIENHLNMIYATAEPLVPPRVIAALLNSQVLDELFRCISGSVAVSAFELEALPLPAPEALGQLEHAIGTGATRNELEALLETAYHDNTAPTARAL